MSAAVTVADATFRHSTKCSAAVRTLARVKMSDNSRCAGRTGTASNRSIHACEIPMSTPFPRELLKAADIAKMEPTRAVHSLNPNAVRLKRQLSDLTGLTQFGVHLLTLMPGHESAEYHRHLYEEEFVYVLSGTGSVTIGERASEIGPGDFIGFPRGGEAHTVQNTGEAPLELLVGGQRLEHDVCEYPRIGKRLYIAGELEEYVELPKRP